MTLPLSYSRQFRSTSPIPKSLVPNPKVVAREGLEPSKPLGRQIYSLLRLTASLPRRSRGDIDVRIRELDAPSIPRCRSLPQETRPHCGSCGRARSLNDPAICLERKWFLASIRVWGEARYLELAKGFEPPTR